MLEGFRVSEALANFACFEPANAQRLRKRETGREQQGLDDSAHACLHLSTGLRYGFLSIEGFGDLTFLLPSCEVRIAESWGSTEAASHSWVKEIPEFLPGFV